VIVNHDENIDKPFKIYNLGVSFLRGVCDQSQVNQLVNWIYIADKEKSVLTVYYFLVAMNCRGCTIKII